MGELEAVCNTIGLMFTSCSSPDSRLRMNSWMGSTTLNISFSMAAPTQSSVKDRAKNRLGYLGILTYILKEYDSCMKCFWQLIKQTQAHLYSRKYIFNLCLTVTYCQCFNKSSIYIERKHFFNPMNQRIRLKWGDNGSKGGVIPQLWIGPLKMQLITFH